MTYLPPGFRSGNPGYMLLAGFVYYLLIYCCFDLKVTNASLPALTMIRVSIFLMFLFIILFSTNYLDIQSQITIFKSKTKPLNIINIIVIDLMAVAVTVAALMIVSFFVQ